MNAKTLLTLVIGGLLLAIAEADTPKKVHIVTLSKVEAAKGREREKLFSDWLAEPALKTFINQGKSQVLFFEYNGPRDKWRAITTDKVKFKQFSWWSFYGESGIEGKLNEEMQRGLKPAFISRNGNYYALLMVSADDFEAARKELSALGVGEPKLR